jgi:hypothetical protein
MMPDQNPQAGEIGTLFLKPILQRTCDMILNSLHEASDMNSEACTDADPKWREAGAMESVAKEKSKRMADRARILQGASEGRRGG